MSDTIQYIIVGAILLASAIWIVVKFRKKKEGTDTGCCGCSLADSCGKVKKESSSCCDNCKK